MGKTLHQLATSLGTKRGIFPYWSRWRRGREKGQNCKFHNACLEEAGDKRELYRRCFYCRDSEGAIRAIFRPKRSFDQVIEDMKKHGKTRAIEMWLEAEKKLKERMDGV